MKFTHYFAIALAFTAQSAFAASESREIPIQALLVPSNELAENETVRVVVRGELPHVCYELGASRVERIDNGRTFRITQFASRRQDAFCGSAQGAAGTVQMTVPFSHEIILGQLPAGQYKIQFNQCTHGRASRELNILPSTVEETSHYAAVSKIVLPESIPSDQELIVRLEGFLESSCSELDGKEVRIERSDDVVVIKPLTTVRGSSFCASVLKPFELELNLGRQNVGHFLVVVRSKNGETVNQLVEVTP